MSYTKRISCKHTSVYSKQRKNNRRLYNRTFIRLAFQNLLMQTKLYILTNKCRNFWNWQKQKTNNAVRHLRTTARTQLRRNPFLLRRLSGSTKTPRYLCKWLNSENASNHRPKTMWVCKKPWEGKVRFFGLWRFRTWTALAPYVGIWLSVRTF